MTGVSPIISVISISMSGLNPYWIKETLKLGLKNKSAVYAASNLHEC